MYPEVCKIHDYPLLHLPFFVNIVVVFFSTTPNVPEMILLFDDLVSFEEGENGKTSHPIDYAWSCPVGDGSPRPIVACGKRDNLSGYHSLCGG
jgi:hypothetical protein